MNFGIVVSMIRGAQQRAYHAVNFELINLYWHIGEYLCTKVHDEGWGKGVVVQLAAYIQSNEPNIKGFSDKNLWRMKQFYETYKDNTKLSTLSRVLPETVVQNFKEQYVLDFLNMSEPIHEDSLQKGLVREMKRFILELGRDFIFIGDEYRLQVGNKDFYVDLLFYHRGLRCLVAFELKTTDFKPEYLGQLNFYLEALDRDVKKADENPSIGVLLCKGKDDEVVEYALNRSMSPTLVSQYELALPNKKLLQTKLRELASECITDTTPSSEATL